MQTGCKFSNDVETIVRWTDYLTVGAENKVETSFTAVGTEGNEIPNLYIKNADGTLGTKLKQGEAASATDFTYSAETKELGFDGTTVKTGMEIVAFYDRKIKGTVLENNSDTYSEKCTLYVDAIGEDTCGAQYRVQIYIPKADFDGNWDMEIDRWS